MHHGRLMAQRQLVLAQAAVLFFDGRPEDLETFVRTGHLASRPKVIPCSLKMLEAMQRQTDQRKGR